MEMAKNHDWEEQIEGKLKDYFQAEANNLRAPADLWARLEPRLEKLAERTQRPSVWQRLTAPWRSGPLPAAATVVALLLVVMTTWLFTAAPWQGPPPVAPLEVGEARGLQGPQGAAGPASTLATPAPAPTPTPRPAAMPILTKAATSAPAGTTPTPAPRAPRPAPTPMPAAAGGYVSAPEAPAATDVLAQALVADRMVIRNGTLSLVVQETARAIDQASQLTDDMGGYVVSSRTWQEGKKVAGTIAIRVPAESFSAAMAALKAMAAEVVTEEVSGKDVTEEFVDLSSRLQNLQATEEQLLKVMQKATQVNDVLSVQRELTRVQGEIEQIQGRKQYLERSSATSLIQVTLREVGLDINITVSTPKARMGEEIWFGDRVAGGFPPYSYRWDLGDGTTSDEETPVHAYGQVGRFDVSLTVTDDKNNTTTETSKGLVTILPMEVRFDASPTEVQVGQKVRFSPQLAGGFSPYSYQWDLGDDTISTERAPTHSYSQAGRYSILLTVTDDKGNTALETQKQFIIVTAPPGWSMAKEAAGAVRALSAIGQGLGTGLIWMAVLLPVWGLVVGLIVAALVRRRRSV